METKIENNTRKFKKVVILDSVIFYPEHRKILDSIAEEVVEYPSSLPENLEKQYVENPEMFKEKKCYTQIAADNIPLQLLMNRVEGAEVIISCWTNIPDEILKLNHQLKLIIFWTHEKEHRLNMGLARKLGIEVCNIPDYGTDSVAELVFAGLFELIKRNFPTQKTKENLGASQEVFRTLFEKYRLYLKNEKQTRRGQFLHHFHKLGMVEFNINKDNLNSVIPEKLIEKKTLGIIGRSRLFKIVSKIARNSFGMHVQEIQEIDSDKAEFYKFIAENEHILIDPTKLKEDGLKLLNMICPNKLLDISQMQSRQYNLDKKVIGIIGMGRIGEKVARMAKPLGLKVIYYSKTRKENLEKEIGINYVELDKLLIESDIISIHLPAHKADNLISKEKLDLIKEGAIFINTADGNIVDQNYLTELMSKNKIYAFLDVYPGLPRKDTLGLSMKDDKDWKIRSNLSRHLLTYRGGWKTQESINVKTYKLIGHMINHLLRELEDDKN